LPTLRKERPCWIYSTGSTQEIQ